MYTIKLVKILPSTVCVVLTWAPYSTGEVEDTIINNIKSTILINRTERNSFDEETYNKIVKNIHNLLIEKGDKAEYRKKYKWDSFKWYQAYCEVLIINLYEENSKDFFEYAYVGEFPIYSYNKLDEKLELINFIHNIKSEVDMGTIEKSCLAPFHSRKNEDIARQVMPSEPQYFIDMLANCEREIFIDKLAHTHTRHIGYFQKVGSSEAADYRIEPPKVTYGRIRFEKDCMLVIYKPKIRDIIPFSKEKLDEIVKKSFYEKKGSIGEADMCSELEFGDIVTIDKDFIIKK